MLVRLFVLMVLLLVGTVPASAAWPNSGQYPNGCTQATAFLSRTKGMPAPYVLAYTNLICGLVQDGEYSKLDTLYAPASQYPDAAYLNIISTSYTLSPTSAPWFTSGQGFSGDGSTSYLTTGYIPSTNGVNYTINSASLGVYVFNSRTGGAAYAEIGGNSSANATDIWPKYTDGKAYIEVNGNGTGTTNGGNASGLWVGSRTGATTNTAYHNGVVFGTYGTASTTLVGCALLLLNTCNVNAFSGDTIAVAFMGAGLTGTDITKIQERVSSYINAVTSFTTAPYAAYNWLYACNNANRAGAVHSPLIMLESNDGLTFSYRPSYGISGLPAGESSITPSIIYLSGTAYMLTNVSGAIATVQTHIDVSQSPTSALQFSYLGQISFSSVISGAGAAVYSAQWFVDSDGSVHVFAAASNTGTSSTGFQVYETHPTVAGVYTTWSTPVAIAGTGLPANLIDPMVTKIGSTYYMFAVDEDASSNIDLLSSSSLTTGWSVIESGNWAGWGTGLEAPFVFVNGSNFEILLDAKGSGMFYSMSPTSGGLTGTWSTKQLVKAPFTPQHGTLIPMPSGY